MQIVSIRVPTIVKYEFKDENQLQAITAEWLESQGFYSIQREVPAGSGRVDIIADTCLIEIKPVLNRTALQKAYGQLGDYASDFPGYQKVIAGQTPHTSVSEESSYRIAESYRSQNIQIWYLYKNDSFNEFMYENYIVPDQAEENNYSTRDSNLEDLIGDINPFGSSSDTHTYSDSSESIIWAVAGIVGLIIFGGIASANFNLNSNYRSPEFWNDEAHRLMQSPNYCDQILGTQINDILFEAKSRPIDLESVIPRIVEDARRNCYGN